MIHLFWNFHDFGLDTVVQVLHGLIRKHRLSMIFLPETKMKGHRIERVRRRMGYFNGFHVAPIGKAGGLSLLSDDSLKVEVMESLKIFIDPRCSLC